MAQELTTPPSDKILVEFPATMHLDRPIKWAGRREHGSPSHQNGRLHLRLIEAAATNGLPHANIKRSLIPRLFVISINLFAYLRCPIPCIELISPMVEPIGLAS